MAAGTSSRRTSSTNSCRRRFTSSDDSAPPAPPVPAFPRLEAFLRRARFAEHHLSAGAQSPTRSAAAMSCEERITSTSTSASTSPAAATPRALSTSPSRARCSAIQRSSRARPHAVSCTPPSPCAAMAFSASSIRCRRRPVRARTWPPGTSGSSARLGRRRSSAARAERRVWYLASSSSKSRPSSLRLSPCTCPTSFASCWADTSRCSGGRERRPAIPEDKASSSLVRTFCCALLPLRNATHVLSAAQRNEPACYT